jgi:hypothetical protein
MEITMSAIKSLTLAAAVVVGITSFANAASYRTYHQYNQSAANTNTAEHFQDKFRNTY